MAPVSGTVASLNGVVGQWISGGPTSSVSTSSTSTSSTSSTSFVTLIDVTAPQISAAISEADIGKVQPGQKATFTLTAFPSRTFTGSVAAIEPAGTTTSNVVTYTVLIAIDPTDVQVLPDMTATVTIITQSADNAILVPNSAISYAASQATAARSQGAATTGGQGAAAGGQGGAARGQGAAAGGQPAAGDQSTTTGAQPADQGAAGSQAASAGQGGAAAAWPGRRRGRQGRRGRRPTPRTGRRSRSTAADGAPTRAPAFNAAVLVLRNGAPVRVPIQTGITDGVNTQVLAGLQAGDPVVTGASTTGTSAQSSSSGSSIFGFGGGGGRPQGGGGGGGRPGRLSRHPDRHSAVTMTPITITREEEEPGMTTVVDQPVSAPSAAATQVSAPVDDGAADPFALLAEVPKGGRGNLRLLQTIPSALAALRANKGRSILTTLGIIIGVAAVIAIVALGEGASASVASQLAGLGTNLLTIQPGSTQSGGARTGAGSAVTLKAGDAAAITHNIQGLSGVSPVVSGNAQIIAGSQNWSTRVQAVTPPYLPIESWTIAQGAAFTDADNTNSNNVAVLGDTVATNLFPVGSRRSGRSSASATCRLPWSACWPRRAPLPGGDQDDTVLIPFQTGQVRLFGATNINQIIVQVTDGSQIDNVTTEMTTLAAAAAQADHHQPDQRLHHPQQQRHHLARLQRQLDDDHAAGWCGGRVAGRRRHRDHEHHAGLGDRTDPRNRHPPGHRRPAARRAGAIPGGSGGAVRDGRSDRHPGRCNGRTGAPGRRRLDHGPALERDRPVLRRLRGDRHVLRHLPRPQSLPARPHRRPALRIVEHACTDGRPVPRPIRPFSRALREAGGYATPSSARRAR